MAVNVNKSGQAYAKSLIKAGKVNNGPWSFSGADGNALLGDAGDDWANFAKYHLAEDTDATENTKARYKYPFGKAGELYSRALVAIKGRSTQQGETDINNAAQELWDMLMATHADSICPECGGQMGETQCMMDGCTGKPMKKKMDRADAPRVNRIDNADAPKWMTDTFTRTLDGFLTGRAVVTSIGVFTYRNADGSVQRELRIPEEVFDSESLDTLKLKPVTNNHPASKIVTPQNVQSLQVGSLGNQPSRYTDPGSYGSYKDQTDGVHVAIDMIVTEEQAIADVNAGKRNLSCGYTCELEAATPGATYMGQEYDFIQRNIRYNHVAIVDTARAGDTARIRLDSGDAILVENQKGGHDMPLKKINLDGVDYEAESKVLEVLHQTKERNDGLTKQVSTLEAERDTLKDQVIKQDAELAKLKTDSADSTKVSALVSAKLGLMASALKAGVEVKVDQADIDIQKAVVMKVYPTAKLDGKDPVYIQARFDAAMEQIETETAADAQARTVGVAASAPSSSVKVDGKETDANAARAKFIESLKNDSRGKE